MRTTIELPDSIYRKGEKVARTQGVTIEEFIIRASKEPCTLDLKDFNFDDLLA